MAREYASFVVRDRRAGAGEPLEVEHIQSGERARAASLAAAIAWIQARSPVPAAPGPAAYRPEQGGEGHDD